MISVPLFPGGSDIAFCAGMEQIIKYGKEQLEGTLEEEEQDANIRKVQEVITKEEEQEAINSVEQQVVTVREVKQVNTIKQEEQRVTMKEEQELPVTVLNSLHEATPLLVKVNRTGVIIKVKEEVTSDTPEATTITQVTIKEEQQELPLTEWNTLHETSLLLVKVKSPGTITKVKEEAQTDASQATQTLRSAVQESVKAPLATVTKDDLDCQMLKSKPSDISRLGIAREISAPFPDRKVAEIEVCVDFDDLSRSKQDMLYVGNAHRSEKRCQKRTAVSDLVNEKSPTKKKKGSQCSSKTSAVTTEVVGQDDAENLQEKAIGSSEMSNRRTFALSALRDQCLKVITQWYMGQPFSEIVHNMNMNPDSVRHILHVWCTEKRLACHKPSQCKLKGKVRTKKGQVPTLWKWRFLVAVGKNFTLQCMVCDRRLNSSKMDNIVCHIRNWHPYSAELPHRVRRAIHQAWKRRQQGLHKAQELQANCTEKRDMTSLLNEQDKMTSLSLSMPQNAQQKSNPSSHVQEIKKTINDSRLCNQTEDYTVQYVGNTEEKRESDAHQNDHIHNNNRKQTPSKKQRQIRYFQDQWRQKYLVDYDWKAEEVVCLVCGLRMRCLRSCTFERHAQRRHPESIHYSKEIRNALWESWNKGQHSFPLLNARSGMGNVKVSSNRIESQPGLIKHRDPGLQEWSEGCTEKLEKTRLQAVQDKPTPVVQHKDRPPIRQRLHNCQLVQEQQNTSESMLNNHIEDYSVQYATHCEDKEPDTYFKKPDTQHIWNTHIKQNDMPQALLKKQKHMRNFQEHWRQKYLVDYDWKTEEAVCILCGLHMRSLRSCTFERHAQRRHPESVYYPEETRIALWKTWSKGEHVYPLHHNGGNISDTIMCQDEMESQQSWHDNHGPSMSTEEYMAIQEEHVAIKHEQRSQNCFQEQQNTINKSRLNYQIDNYTIQYVTHHEDKDSDIHFQQPYIKHIWNIHEEQNYNPHVLLKKQKHMRNFQEHWRLKYLVDYDWKTEEAVCILCGLHMRSLRNCTFERHARRRHPESIHYPEETRIALWKTWSKGEHSYTLNQTGGSISDLDMCQDDIKSNPSWQESHEPSMNTEEYMAIQQEQIESVLKSTNTQREVYS